MTFFLLRHSLLTGESRAGEGLRGSLQVIVKEKLVWCPRNYYDN